ncbi:MAG: glyoxalase/bleomycin resistance/extradiol dioxygenase family protein [Anaeromyxobacteraceae bacterium]
MKDLARSMTFFGALGFTFEPRFTDEKAACMIVSPQAFVMLLSEPFFRTFTKRPTGDPTRETAALYALSCESRAEVDDLVKRAIASGGGHAMDPVDHGFMYGWSFLDPDGHHWEVMWMDPAHARG